jgi:hypothetical protein
MVNQPADEVKPPTDEKRHAEQIAKDFVYAEAPQTVNNSKADTKCRQSAKPKNSLQGSRARPDVQVSRIPINT